jgi:photosystem II PsbH protein
MRKEIITSSFCFKTPVLGGSRTPSIAMQTVDDWGGFRFNFFKLFGSAFPKKVEGEVLKTKLSPLLKPLNKDVGLVVLGWGTTPLMVVILIFFLIFLLILLNIYNTTVFVEGVDVDWEDFI